MNDMDPWSVLGLEPGASDPDIEAAYRARSARAAAASDDAATARIAAAYGLLEDPRARARDRLFGPRPLADVDELVDVLCRLPRAPAGAALWLDALRERG